MYNNLYYLFNFLKKYLWVFFMHNFDLCSICICIGNKFRLLDCNVCSVQFYTRDSFYYFCRALEVEIIHCAVYCETFSSCLL